MSASPFESLADLLSGWAEDVLHGKPPVGDAGRGLLVLSSVGRQPTGKHGKSSYEGFGLASFKESGDIEYAADDCYTPTPPADGLSEFRHVQARHTEAEDIVLRARLDVMAFDPTDPDPRAADRSGLLDAARKLCGNGKPKGDGG